MDLPAEEPHQLFEFLNTEKRENGLIETLGGLLPEAQDYQEEDFANKMKKKRKYPKGQK